MMKLLKKLTAFTLSAAILSNVSTGFFTQKAKAYTYDVLDDGGNEMWHWYRPKSVDDVPKDETFRLLIICSSPNYEFKNMANDLHKIEGGAVRYISVYDDGPEGSIDRRSHANHYNCAVATREMLQVVDLTKDEFYSVDDFYTPYARVIKEDEPGTERPEDGLSGHSTVSAKDSAIYKEYFQRAKFEDKYTTTLAESGRHYSRDKDGGDVLSPLIRIADCDRFTSYDCYVTANHKLDEKRHYHISNMWPFSDEDYYLYFSRTFKSFCDSSHRDEDGADDVFELTVNPNPNRTTGLCDEDAGFYVNGATSFIQHPGLSGNDTTLAFEYYNSMMHWVEYNNAQDNESEYMCDYSGFKKLDYWWVGDCGSKWDWWEFYKDSLTVKESSNEKWVDPQFSINKLFSLTVTPEEKIIRENKLRVTPIIYIGVKSGISTITGNKRSDEFVVEAGKTENIQNVTLIPKNMTMTISEDATLIVGGWLVVEGVLKLMNNATLIVDTGGLVSYLSERSLRRMHGSKLILGPNSTTIILQGGMIIGANIEQNNSRIINYGYFGFGTLGYSEDICYSMVNSILEARRNSTTKKFALKSKDLSEMWIKRDKKTGLSKDIVPSGYGEVINNLKMDNDSKIIASDMINDLVLSGGLFNIEKYYEK